jgi:galactose-1-phosphate uridylyltransferase
MIAELLCGKAEYVESEIADKDNYLYAHRDMIKELMANGLVSDMQTAEKIVTDRVNFTCKNILFNTAVFKNDENGEKGFNRFLNENGIK